MNVVFFCRDLRKKTNRTDLNLNFGDKAIVDDADYDGDNDC
jgi:hypothetical protein